MNSDKKVEKSKIAQSSQCPLPYLTSQMALGVSVIALKNISTQDTQESTIKPKDSDLHSAIAMNSEKPKDSESPVAIALDLEVPKYPKYDNYRKSNINSSDELTYISTQMSELISDMRSVMKRVSDLQEVILKLKQKKL